MLVRPSKLWSHTCSMIMVRENTRPAFATRYSSSAYSLAVNSMRLPARLTCCDKRSSSRSATRRTLARLTGPRRRSALFLICSCSRGHQPKTNATGLLYQVEPYGGKPRVEYINAAGEVALVPALSWAWSGEFHEGLAVAWSGQENDGKTKWGLDRKSTR